MIKYTVIIDDYETIDDKVHYQIIVSSTEGHKMFTKRYSDLKTFNDRIVEKNSDFKLHLNLPHFPGRKIFGRTSNSIAGIKARVLKQFTLGQGIVLNIKQLQSFQLVREMLPYDSAQETIKINQSGEYDKDLCWLQMDELKRSFLERHEMQAPRNPKAKSNSHINTTGYVQRYHFSFDDFVIQQETVLYTITMTDAKKTTKYSFVSRYSDLREYHQLLKKKNLKSSLPKFPKRKLIGQTNENPLEIQERLEQLQKYLNNVFGVKELVHSEPLQYFVTRIKLEGKPIRMQMQQQQAQLSKSILFESQDDLANRKNSY